MPSWLGVVIHVQDPRSGGERQGGRTEVQGQFWLSSESQANLNELQVPFSRKKRKAKSNPQTIISLYIFMKERIM